MSELAPIILFVYARPTHTRATLEALGRNDYAKDSRLIIYSDAAKSDAHITAVQQVRDLLRNMDLDKSFAQVTIIERSRNYGLAQSIISGVTEACNEYGKAIVLEDDIVTSKYFLRFMNDGLNEYAASDSVYAVSGCSYPVHLGDYPHDTYFLRLPLCWGWATWTTKWNAFEKKLSSIDATPTELVRYINFGGAHDFFRQARENVQGTINTWFIFWYLSVAKRRGLVLFPSKTMAVNIGHDGSGENCSSSSNYDLTLAKDPLCVSQLPVVESARAVSAHLLFFQSLKGSVMSRVKRRITQMRNGKWLG